MSTTVDSLLSEEISRGLEGLCFIIYYIGQQVLFYKNETRLL